MVTQVLVATQVMVVKNMVMIQTWAVTHVVTPVRREAMAKHSSTGLFHFVYGASPHQILLHLPIILLHFPIKFASFPQQIASSPQQIASFPQQIASFPQQNSHFPITILLHFAKN